MLLRVSSCTMWNLEYGSFTKSCTLDQPSSVRLSHGKPAMTDGAIARPKSKTKDPSPAISSSCSGRFFIINISPHRCVHRIKNKRNTEYKCTSIVVCFIISRSKRKPQLLKKWVTTKNYLFKSFSNMLMIIRNCILKD